MLLDKYLLLIDLPTRTVTGSRELPLNRVETDPLWDWVYVTASSVSPISSVVSQKGAIQLPLQQGNRPFQAMEMEMEQKSSQSSIESIANHPTGPIGPLRGTVQDVRHEVVIGLPVVVVPLDGFMPRSPQHVVDVGWGSHPLGRTLWCQPGEVETC